MDKKYKQDPYGLKLLQDQAAGSKQSNAVSGIIFQCLRSQAKIAYIDVLNKKIGLLQWKSKGSNPTIDFDLKFLSAFVELAGMMIQLQQLVNSLEKDNNYLRALKQAKKTCCIDEAELKALTPSSVFLYLQRLNNKNLAQTEDKSEGYTPSENSWSDRWHPNEYKHFSWLVVGYFFIKNQPITAFTQEDIQFFVQIFVNKQRTFLQYHLLSLIKQSKPKREVWMKQETELLIELMNSEKYKGKWSDISYRLYHHSHRVHFRSSHKCREMWFNHLNPAVRHHKWALEEDISLFQLVTRNGTKWAQISKAMEGVRTQHMVKNRFNSLIKKYSLKYQRYSLKKLAEIIQRDLQAKLVNNEASENSKQENKLQEMEQDEIKIQKEEGKQQIMFLEPQTTQDVQQIYPSTILPTIQTASLQEKKCQENTGTNSSVTELPKMAQFNFFIPEPIKVERQRQGYERDENTKHLQNYQMDLIAQMQWTIKCKADRVELIDYLGVQYEFKPTIFSGTN